MKLTELRTSWLLRDVAEGSKKEGGQCTAVSEGRSCWLVWGSQVSHLSWLKLWTNNVSLDQQRPSLNAVHGLS